MCSLYSQWHCDTRLDVQHVLNRGGSLKFLCPCFNVSVENLILTSVQQLVLQMELMRALIFKNQAAYLSSDI